MGTDTAAGAAKTIIGAEPVLGSLLILAMIAVVGLALYVKGLHRDYQTHIREIQEKRIEEGRAALSLLGDVKATLFQATEAWREMERSTDASSLVLRDVSSETRASAAAIREAVGRVETGIANLSSKIDQPLVETPTGLRRQKGGAS